ncbi:MAG TPA: dihydrofolate reductase family protein [Candidatus Dormibacteraeota bacterium]
MKITVLNHMSLDGIIQSPARPDEDTRGGFSHGGWAVAGADEEVGKWVGPPSAGGAGAMLMGHRSYDDMLGHWNRVGGPFKDALNAARKYVASRNASTQLAWPNSSLLTGDVPEAVAKLKREHDGDLLIMGSGALIHSLVPHNLIDEFRLVIHPLLLGDGVHLFPDDGELHQLELVDGTHTTKGVILATYRAADHPSTQP